ncbi:hypothetical protein SAMN02745704_02930 [Paucidesulfovibrio gracilis DSM 16080]|uniref:Uncharacterized protein n=1 Tax=Paucidesulfovibrio gracilis DSM 16080 TaxID=1121449 RepID=A0A1T4Y9V4_9BACT|nr:hypothetical protein SAMN02745704_02930 [Paucidesulfovibrio gracilis DSM 16080]
MSIHKCKAQNCGEFQDMNRKNGSPHCIETPRNEILAMTFVSSIMTVVAVVIFFFSLLFFLISIDYWILVLPIEICLWWAFVSRFFFIPIQVTESHIVTKFLLWTKLLPLDKISLIRVFSYDYKYPLRLKIVASESITLKINGLFLRYVCFARQPKDRKVGDCLIQRIRAVNPDAVIDIW